MTFIVILLYATESLIKRYQEMRDLQSLSPQPSPIQTINQSMPAPAPSPVIQYEPKPSTSHAEIGEDITFEIIPSTSTDEPKPQVNNWIATNENQESEPIVSASPLQCLPFKINNQSHNPEVSTTYHNYLICIVGPLTLLLPKLYEITNFSFFAVLLKLRIHSVFLSVTFLVYYYSKNPSLRTFVKEFYCEPFQ